MKDPERMEGQPGESWRAHSSQQPAADRRSDSEHLHRFKAAVGVLSGGTLLDGVRTGKRSI